MTIRDALVQSVQPEGPQGILPQVVVKNKIRVSGRYGSSELRCSVIQIVKNPQSFPSQSPQMM
jgi:hypothetical protein